MSSSAIATLCALAGGAIGVGMAVPQLIAIRGTTAQQSAGISLPTWALIITGNICYGIYGVTSHSIAMVLPNAISFIAAGLLVGTVAAVRRSSLTRWYVVWAGAAAFCIATAAHPAIAGWLGASVCLYQRQPQLQASWRRRRSEVEGDHGVSSLTWILSGIATMFWLLYGYFSKDWIVFSSNIVLTAQAIAIYHAETTTPARGALLDQLV